MASQCCRTIAYPCNMKLLYELKWCWLVHWDCSICWLLFIRFSFDVCIIVNYYNYEMIANLLQNTSNASSQAKIFQFRFYLIRLFFLLLLRISNTSRYILHFDWGVFSVEFIGFIHKHIRRYVLQCANWMSTKNRLSIIPSYNTKSFIESREIFSMDWNKVTRIKQQQILSRIMFLFEWKKQHELIKEPKKKRSIRFVEFDFGRCTDLDRLFEAHRK